MAEEKSYTEGIRKGLYRWCPLGSPRKQTIEIHYAAGFEGKDTEMFEVKDQIAHCYERSLVIVFDLTDTTELDESDV